MKITSVWRTVGPLAAGVRGRVLWALKSVWLTVDRMVIIPIMQRLSRFFARDIEEAPSPEEPLPPWKAKSLREFHSWLQELPEGNAPEGSMDACDLFTLLSEFTALRQEIHLQNGEQSQSVKSVTDMLDTYKADLDQYQRRSEVFVDAEKRILAYAEKKSVFPFLDVRESLERGLESSRELAADFYFLKSTKARHAVVVAGYESALRRFDRALAMTGVEVIETKGKFFDPACMRVVQKEKDEAAPSEAVLREIVRGFRLNGEVLRPAEVIVNE